MKTLIYYLVWISTLLSADAKPISVEDEIPPLPSGPILKRLPDMSSWQITYVYPEDKDKQKTESLTTPVQKVDKGSLPDFLPPRKIVVTKTNPIWSAVCIDVEGRKIEEWSPGNGRFVDLQGTVMPLPEMEGIAGGELTNEVNCVPSFSGFDFPGMDWISKENYKGIQKVGPRVFYVFQDEPKGLIAWVDAATQFPVRLIKGDEIRTLQLLPPPTQMLTIPPAFYKSIENEKAVRKALGSP